MDWQSLLAVGALVVAVFTALSRSFDKSLSIREHEEFRNAIKGDIAQVREDYHRDDARIEARIVLIEQTRPTTGELEARIDSRKDRG
jgi:hypothetical protein